MYRFQDLESAESILLKAQLEEVDKKLNNLAEAMAQGIFSATTKRLLDDLEAQKKSIETDIIQYQIRNPIVPKEQLLFALYNYRKLDMSVQSDRQKLIDSFVNSIYLYDDHFIITFNYKNTSKKVSLKEINSSSLTSSTPPIEKVIRKDGLFYWYRYLAEGNRKDGTSAHTGVKIESWRAIFSPWEIPFYARCNQYDCRLHKFSPAKPSQSLIY